MLPSLSDFPNLPANNPARAGRRAARSVRFGPYGRYAIVPMHSRFPEDPLIWFVWDAEVLDPEGWSEIVRQEPSLEAALAGLDMSDPYEEENVNV
jgi:hypothetical protein